MITTVNLTFIALRCGSATGTIWRISKLKVGDLVVLSTDTGARQITALGPVVQVGGDVLADLLDWPDRVLTAQTQMTVGDSLPGIPGTTIRAQDARVGDRICVTVTRRGCTTQHIGYVGEISADGVRVGDRWIRYAVIRRSVTRIAVGEADVWEIRARPVNAAVNRRWAATAVLLGTSTMIEETLEGTCSAVVQAIRRQIRQYHDTLGRGQEPHIVVVRGDRRPPRYEIRPALLPGGWAAPVWVQWDSIPRVWRLVSDDVVGAASRAQAVAQARHLIPIEMVDYRDPPEVTVTPASAAPDSTVHA